MGEPRTVEDELTDVVLSCAGVLFDCDGVLVDSLAAGERAWTQWAQHFGFAPSAVLDGIHGRRSAETVALFLPPDERPAAQKWLDDLEVAEAASTRPIAGAARLLAGLPDNWAVVTSAPPGLVEARLRAAGLPIPPVVVTGRDVRAGKPDPEGYLRAAAALGHAPADCVVLEDSAAGVAAGRAAGAGQVVGVGVSALGTDARPVVPDLRAVRWSGAGLVIDGAARLDRRPAD